jgi:KaiC/GvpD/RAD55 family RecA-like ATPase
LNYNSPLEEFDEETHGKVFSSPWAMKSSSRIKVKVMDKGKQQVKDAHKKESTPQWAFTLMSSVKRLEQKVDSTMDEVDVLKKKRNHKRTRIVACYKIEKKWG